MIEISWKLCGAHQHASWGHNFLSNCWNFNFFSVQETIHPYFSKDTKTSSIWVR